MYLADDKFNLNKVLLIHNLKLTKRILKNKKY